jgi:hypothetical protein
MENKFEVCVKLEIKDGRSHISLVVPPSQDLSLEEVGKVLAGGLALAIKSSEKEAEYMKEIMEYLQSEFVNIDSFSDSKRFI